MFSDQSLVMEYQYLLGGVIASVFVWGLLLAFHAKGRKKVRVSMDIPRDSTLKSSENGMSWARNPESTDIIIVGAGVAGSALACTLGKVTLHDTCFSRND
jgi:squalene monooxygenase